MTRKLTKKEAATILTLWATQLLLARPGHMRPFPDDGLTHAEIARQIKALESAPFGNRGSFAAQ
jgi:hypothetical protein